MYRALMPLLTGHMVTVALQVIAIEPNWRTLRHLAASIVLGKVTDRFVLLHNAVSNDSGSMVHIGIDKGNIGNTWVLSDDYCKQHANNTECRTSAVATITLDDLLAASPVRLGGADRWRVIMKVILMLIGQFRHSTGLIYPCLQLTYAKLPTSQCFIQWRGHMGIGGLLNPLFASRATCGICTKPQRKFGSE
jgi:FkbM family methyltransferase